ncbi:unnamed protein product [Adineta steineri]|uniref:Uncharacterized protein n=1 Tax=Adineta steineri TaxID=433720 RepID=A0A815ASH4_9BILA|nr:unnamed protein product [Adineta steineri]CAF1263696.1 unnamed protein product [Adineta steineri]
MKKDNYKNVNATDRCLAACVCQKLPNGEILRLGRDILERLIELQSYENQFLLNTLRQYFDKLDAPEDRNKYLSILIEKFSKRFQECNKDLGLSSGSLEFYFFIFRN